MRDAVIVSTARTPIGKAFRGAFNNTHAQELIGHAVRHAVDRAGLEGGEVQDCVIGTAIQQGSTGGNIGRQAVIRAGLPTSVAGMSMDRQCASGMMAIATAAKQVVHDGMQVAIGGGVESISLVQNQDMRTDYLRDPWVMEHVPSLYMSMLETAEIVADRYNVSREDQDEYALQSQQRTAAAQAAGFDIAVLHGLWNYAVIGGGHGLEAAVPEHRRDVVVVAVPKIGHVACRDAGRPFRRNVEMCLQCSPVRGRRGQDVAGGAGAIPLPAQERLEK